jgi:hypothetical protein
MSTAADYIDLGYQGVVVIQEDWREEASGYQNEHTHHVVACRDRSGAHWRLTVNWTYKTMKGTNEPYVEARVVMSEAEYESVLAKHGPVLDSATFHAKQKRAAGAQARLDALKPACPKCNRPMQGRLARGKTPFWGCVGFPKCKGTRTMPDATREQIEALEADR